jgi:uncharacterized phosphosugar-binding protein
MHTGALRLRFPFLATLGLFLLLLQSAVFAALQPALADYAARLPAMRAQIPAIVASAQQAAENNLAHPKALLSMPYWQQEGFAEEMANRAGGLAHAYPTEARRRMTTEHDIVVISIRSWEKQRDDAVKYIKECKANRWVVTVVGSAAGKPAELDADFFIDNGAPSEGVEHGRINALVNITLGWIWCCEYASAMSRQGKFPAVLYSVAMPGAKEYDEKIQSTEGRFTVLPCDTAIPAGQLADLYLKRVDRLMDDCRSKRIQEQVINAADVIAAHMRAGGTVGLSGVGHIIMDEMFKENKTPWKAFIATRSVQTAYKTNLQPGDLLIWMAYCGMNTAYEDYGKYITEAGLRVITCYSPDPTWATPPTAPQVAHIDQSWDLPDAEVSIPLFPYSMAPVSGINATLILRMLDDEVAERLAK